ncbi:hypothetical protein ACQJBY_049146 [Aegilops geniculata]
MATLILRSAVAGLALRRSASLWLPARPASVASFSSNAAAGRFEKRQVDEKNDESDAARRRRKQERHGISRGHAGDSGDSSWMMMMLDDDKPPSTGPHSTTDSFSASRASAEAESDVSSPSSGGFWGGESSWSWGSGGGDSGFGGGDCSGD